MACKHFQETLHVHYHSIVEDILLLGTQGFDRLSVFDSLLFSGLRFKFSLYILFDLLASFVLGLTVHLKNGINSLLNCLLVSFFPDLDNLPHNDILKPILKKIGLGTIQ